MVRTLKGTLVPRPDCPNMRMGSWTATYLAYITVERFSLHCHRTLQAQTLKISASEYHHCAMPASKIDSDQAG